MGGWKIKGSQSFLEQETLRFLLSQFHEQIRALFHKQTKINWGFYGRFYAHC